MNSETELFVYDELAIIERCRAIATNDLLKQNFRMIPKFLFRYEWFRKVHSKFFKYELSYKRLVPRKNENIREQITLLKNGKKVDSIVFSAAGI